MIGGRSLSHRAQPHPTSRHPDIPDIPDIPDHIAIIGADDSGEGLVEHYFDSRGVSRIYKMSLSDGTWKMWRDAPGFLQRFTGTFSDDGKTIKVLGELSRDGVSWERDFEQTYKEVE